METNTNDDSAALVQGILAEAEEKITKALSEASEYEARRLGAAKAQAEALLVAAEKEAAGHAADILAAAKAKLAMEETKSALEFEETLMREAVVLARKAFENIRKRPDYVDKLMLWIAEAAIGVGEAQVVLEVAAEERSLISDAVLKSAETLVKKTVGNDVSIVLSDRKPIATAGILASSQDGRVVYDNTVEARFHRMENSIRSLVRSELDSRRRSADGKARQA